MIVPAASKIGGETVAFASYAPEGSVSNLAKLLGAHLSVRENKKEQKKKRKEETLRGIRVSSHEENGQKYKYSLSNKDACFKKKICVCDNVSQL